MSSHNNYEKTKVLYDGQEIFKITIEDFSTVKKTVEICDDRGSPSMFVNVRLLWQPGRQELFFTSSINFHILILLR